MSVRILIGDVREQLRLLPADFFDCVVTSPPYWGLRDYGVAGQIGLERTLGEHLDVMVDVFAEVRRVMKPTATLWLNYGDCYATSPNGRSAADTKAAGNDDRTFRDKPFSTVGPILNLERQNVMQTKHPGGTAPKSRIESGGHLKPKDLCMIPNRLAIALQESGWYVRSEIIWHKPNPMPESIKDRPGTSHEKVWLLSKSPRYFYDHIAVRQPVTEGSAQRLAQNVGVQVGSDRANGGTKTNGNMKAVGGFRQVGANWTNDSEFQNLTDPSNGANLRNVWTIPTAAFSEAHFATFPPELAERCIKAGCPTGGHVLDPFGGAGTTGLVADRLQRSATLIELNPEYAALARRRIDGDAPLLAFAEAAE